MNAADELLADFEASRSSIHNAEAAYNDYLRNRITAATQLLLARNDADEN